LIDDAIPAPPLPAVDVPPSKPTVPAPPPLVLEGISETKEYAPKYADPDFHNG
jgi:hypothetical protein